MNVTIRNIPEEIMNKIRTLSKLERRSINNEILMILEKGLDTKLGELATTKRNITKELQVAIWNNLAKKWKEEPSEDILRDIYENRTMGRDVEL